MAEAVHKAFHPEKQNYELTGTGSETGQKYWKKRRHI